MHSPPRQLPPMGERLLAALEAEHESAYLLGLDLSVRYVNQAWVRFARENGALELGENWRSIEPVTHFFDGPMRTHLADCFARVIAFNEPWSYIYECSSRERCRTFNMRVAPTARRDALIVVHSRVVSLAPSEAPGTALSDLVRAYTDERGLVVQCSGCDRVRHPKESSWDWAPQVTNERKNVSHGICPTCDFQYYWQDTPTK